MKSSFLALALAVGASADVHLGSGAARVYQSEHYDSEEQAIAAMRRFKIDVVAAGYPLNFGDSAEQVRPVGDSFYFALTYSGFALPQPATYSSVLYASPEQAGSARRWFVDAASSQLTVKVIESGVRSRKDSSYFWARYLGDALPVPSQYTSAPFPTLTEAEGSLQLCLGSAARAKSVVLEKSVREGREGPYYSLRYLGAALSCAR